MKWTNATHLGTEYAALLVAPGYHPPPALDEAAMKNRIKVLRAEKNWSQAELAEKLKVARQSVNAIETGKADPSLPLGMRIARVFGVRVEDVFSDD